MSEQISDFPPATLPLSGIELIAMEQAGITCSTTPATLIPVLTGMSRIVQTVLVPAGNQATITLTLPVGFTNAAISLVGRGTAAVESNALQLTFNGDSGTNYDIESLTAGGAAVAGAATLGATSMFVGSLNGANATVNYPSQVDIRIGNYPDTVFYKSVLSFYNVRSSSSSALGFISGIWKTASSITTATFTLAAGNFLAGTKATLSVQ
jgi:hypothetical protein